MKNSLFTLLAMICLGIGGIFISGCGLEKDPVSVTADPDPKPDPEDEEVGKVDTSTDAGFECGTPGPDGLGYRPCEGGEFSGKVKGDWGVDINLGNIANISIFAELNESSGTHKLYAIEPDSNGFDTVFIHEGEWSVDADSVYLHGQQCFKVDREPEPDTLTSYECGPPIPIHLKKSGNDEWFIKVRDFVPIAENVGISFPPGTEEIEVVFTRNS